MTSGAVPTVRSTQSSTPPSLTVSGRPEYPDGARACANAYQVAVPQQHRDQQSGERTDEAVREQLPGAQQEQSQHERPAGERQPRTSRKCRLGRR